MRPVSSHVPITGLAKKTADTRRVLVNTFGGDLGLGTSLDLMGIENPQRDHLVFAQIIADTHRETLARSTLYLADQDMVELLDAAASTMPDQHLHETDIMVPDGFIYFAEPLPERSGVPPEIPIRAMSWARIPADSPLLVERETDRDAILITSYVTVRDQFEARGLLGPGRDIAPGTPGLLPNATVMWTIDTLIGKAFGEEPPAGGYNPGFYQRALAAFWTLCQQPKITTTSDEPSGKPTDQRRNRRAGITNAAEPVRVVRLKHRPQSQVEATVPGTGDPEDTKGKMKVRSVTSGHWRRQWYRSVEQHRHIWIDPFWRGPEDAPVVGGERVFLASGRDVDPGESPS